MLRVNGLWALLGALVISVPAVARSQTVRLTVHVREEASGRPVKNATVSTASGLAPLSGVTDTNGLVAFHVERGSYVLTVMRLGFAQATSVALHIASDTVIQQTLKRLVLLDTLSVSGGPVVYGVIGTRDYQPINGAEVTVLGVNRSTRTDTAGRFLIAPRGPGNYVLMSRRSGFTDRLISFSLTTSRGVELSVLMDTAGSARFPASALADMRTRLAVAGLNSVLVPGSELLGGGPLLETLKHARSLAAKGLRLDRPICLFVDGMPKPGWPLDAFSSSEVEAIEVYEPLAERSRSLAQQWPPGGACSSTGSIRQPTGAKVGEARAPFIYVVLWTHQS